MTQIPLNLTICVVTYRSAEITRRFANELVQSLADFTHWEIRFYDNSPTDELSDLAALGSYKHDPRNLGFSFANNQVILSAQYPNIALINPDVFGFSREFWQEVSQRALGKGEVRFIKLLNEDGTHQDCVGEITCLSRIWRRGRINYAHITTEQPIGMGIMAFMLTTREVFARVGLLDCDYPLYGEDMDWCYRAHRQGVAVIYDASLRLTHLGGASADDRWSRSASLRKKYQAERIFIDKHRRGLGWLALRAFNWLKPKVRA